VKKEGRYVHDCNKADKLMKTTNVHFSGAVETCTHIHTYPTGLSGDAMGHQIIQHNIHSIPTYGMCVINWKIRK
jgi:hypothetical protein